MYRILVKYNSALKKTYWHDYEVEQEDGTVSPFETDDEKILVEEINKLDKQIGFENIRVVNDISYIINTSVADNTIQNAQVATIADLDEMYDSVYQKVFISAEDTQL